MDDAVTGGFWPFFRNFGCFSQPNAEISAGLDCGIRKALDVASLGASNEI